MNKLILFIVFISLINSQEVLVFSDDFTEFNFSRWKHEITMSGGGNWEFEYYTNNRSNSYVRNGTLYIKPTLTADTIGEANVMNGYTMDLWGGDMASLCTGNNFYGCERTSGAGGNILNPIQSARIRSEESFIFKYGRVEVNAKLPKGDWLWPAIWLLPRYQSYGFWPASGEIDIMESRGNANFPSSMGGGIESFGSTLHWGPDYNADAFPQTHQVYALANGTFNDEFHVFGLVWTEDRIYTYIDNETNIVLDVNITKSFWDLGQFPTYYNNPWQERGNNAPFDQEFYLIFNVAVGGTSNYFPDTSPNKPWTNSDSHAINSFYNAKNQWYATWKGEDAALQIDWVKIYQNISSTISGEERLLQ